MLKGVCICKQETAYEMRISDWSSNVCSSDLPPTNSPAAGMPLPRARPRGQEADMTSMVVDRDSIVATADAPVKARRFSRKTLLLVAVFLLAGLGGATSGYA